jgi:hypothetical protein
VINVVTIEELKKDDKMIVQSGPSSVQVYTISEVLVSDLSVKFKATGDMLYVPENPEQIIILQ